MGVVIGVINGVVAACDSNELPMDDAVGVEWSFIVNCSSRVETSFDPIAEDISLLGVDFVAKLVLHKSNTNFMV